MLNAEPSIDRTEAGISIERRAEQANALDSMCVSREFDSNESDESDLQDAKHDEPRISTFFAITIDRSDECENASDSIRINREFDSNETENG
jgi:hypothetical protein